MNTNGVLISKEEFIDIMDRLRNSYELVQKVTELFENSRDKVEYSFTNGACLQISHESLVVQLLQKIMKDEDEFISYFVYELEYGKEYRTGLVTDEQGEISLRNAGELYDYLLQRV